MDNNENARKGYKTTSSKHISEVVRGDMLIANKAVVVATSDAYMTKTGNGQEWNFECGDEYIYAGEFKDGIVELVTLDAGEGYKLDVDYCSVWDGGVIISTTAKVDIRTGEVTDIIKADIDGLQTCEREYIIMNDTQVEVCTDTHGYAYWADFKNEL